MLRLVICCGGGMSSSILSQKFKEEIINNHLEEKITVAYLPLVFLLKNQANFDFALLCPHLRYAATKAVEEGKVTIPLYFIPSQLYGSMQLLPLLEDTLELINIYKETGLNPVHFPDEDLLVLKRNTSHKRWQKRLANHQ